MSASSNITVGRRALAVLAGVAAPVAVSRLLLLANDPADYWPGGLLTATVVVLAVLFGRRACLVGAGSAVVCAWWWFVEPQHSLHLPTWTEALSLGSLLVSIGCVTLLVLALERSRAATAAQLEVVQAVMSATDIGMGLVDADGRILAMNDRLAELGGAPAAPGLPMPLADLPRLSTIIGDLVASVWTNGVAQRDHERTIGGGAAATHYRLSVRPVDDSGPAVRLVLSVEDVTDAVRAAERSDRIARCAQALAAAATAAEVGEAIGDVLATTFGAQVSLAVVTADRDHLELVHVAGFHPDISPRWVGRGWRLDERNPNCDALRSGGWLEFREPAQFDAAYPELAERRETVAAESMVVVPLRGAVNRHDSLGVLQLVWTRRFTLTESSREHIGLVASLAQLALAHLELVELASRDEFRSALDSMIGDVTIGRAVRDEQQRIVDFVIEFVTSNSVEGTGRSVADVIGRRMLELVPHWADNGFFDVIARVVDTGVPFVDPRLRLQVATADGPRADRRWSVQVTRFRDGYLLAWRDVTDEVETERVAQGARESALRERAAVAVLQEASLPKYMPSDPRLEVVARYEPVAADMPVGGDWYDVFPLDDGRLGFVIADVAGHGRDAASEMVQLRNKLRGASFAGDAPEHVMQRINRMAIRSGAMATCQYAVLDLDRLQLEWVSAGHVPLLHVPAGGTPQLIGPSGDLLLGVDRNHRFHPARLQLAPGDVVLLYTDGLVERRREHLDTGLARLVSAAGGGGDLATIVADTVRLAPNNPREDDLCLLGIRITSGG